MPKVIDSLSFLNSSRYVKTGFKTPTKSYESRKKFSFVEPVVTSDEHVLVARMLNFC